MSTNIPSIDISSASISTADSESTLASSQKQSGKVRARERSGSLVKVEEVGNKSQEEVLDQSVYVNINAEWVNSKGAWLIHPVLIAGGKIIVDALPGMTQEFSWTFVNLAYLSLSYLMFHWVTGIPFHNDLHGGVYDDLTLWEQIDEGAQYTPAKKWLVCFPIALFLASTHYTHYNPWYFALNLTALIFVLIPKLPVLHRQRVRFLPQDATTSGRSTPRTSVFLRSGSETPPARFASTAPLKVENMNFG